ncbi:hypothetical protein V8G54_029418 [Vigna mungo]|uniref:Uncharacterized protein n=1 Tax=Vigna mungo TaxID=3915 RepID=A0AAQ3MU65_VIGMU
MTFDHREVGDRRRKKVGNSREKLEVSREEEKMVVPGGRRRKSNPKPPPIFHFLSSTLHALPLGLHFLDEKLNELQSLSPTYMGNWRDATRSRPFGVSLLIAGHDENGPSL